MPTSCPFASVYIGICLKRFEGVFEISPRNKDSSQEIVFEYEISFSEEKDPNITESNVHGKSLQNIGLFYLGKKDSVLYHSHVHNTWMSQTHEMDLLQFILSNIKMSNTKGNYLK